MHSSNAFAGTCPSSSVDAFTVAITVPRRPEACPHVQVATVSLSSSYIAVKRSKYRYASEGSMKLISDCSLHSLPPPLLSLQSRESVERSLGSADAVLCLPNRDG